MFVFKLLFVFGAIISLTWARPETEPNDESTRVPSIQIPSDTNKDIIPIPTHGVVYGIVVNFTSPELMKPIESIVPVETEETSSPSGEKLVRKKRFLFGLVGSALQSLRNDNWRECGRTPWGTTIYTNGFATSCFGACPEEIYCGYGYGYNGYNGYDGYSYGRYSYGSHIQIG
ncbi:hypothetical protein HA402_001291 [Bradysia odoriphaga]|nr:hypothetical protein HA402_001291 [Bradysia odoriphaga]